MAGPTAERERGRFCLLLVIRSRSGTRELAPTMPQYSLLGCLFCACVLLYFISRFFRLGHSAKFVPPLFHTYFFCFLYPSTPISFSTAVLLSALSPFPPLFTICPPLFPLINFTFPLFPCLSLSSFPSPPPFFLLSISFLFFITVTLELIPVFCLFRFHLSLSYLRFLPVPYYSSLVPLILSRLSFFSKLSSLSLPFFEHPSPLIFRLSLKCLYPIFPFQRKRKERTL